MADITWEDAFCGEGNSCYRIGVDGDGDGNSYVAVAGGSGNCEADPVDGRTRA